ncbi:MAG: hypothetical protein HFI50_13825 [Lachnospiraceae bacterium]|nr:hypothetical protein [Lachnospiraceae bacterium]
MFVAKPTLLTIHFAEWSGWKSNRRRFCFRRKLVCDEEDVRQLETLEGINLEQADNLRSLFVNGIRYQDGTILQRN